MSEHSRIVECTRDWVEETVIGLNLCPFARVPQQSGRVRYVVSEARDVVELISDLLRELVALRENSVETLETTLLIHPWVLQDFHEYNDFLYDADELLERNEFSGEFQIASLHPHYQFADTHYDDAENYTNRSPYPMLHLLREDSITKALESYQDPQRIPERNIRLMEKYGAAEMKKRLLRLMEES